MNLVLTRGEGVQNPKNLTDVICERPLIVMARIIICFSVTFSKTALLVSKEGMWVTNVMMSS